MEPLEISLGEVALRISYPQDNHLRRWTLAWRGVVLVHWIQSRLYRRERKGVRMYALSYVYMSTLVATTITTSSDA